MKPLLEVPLKGGYLYKDAPRMARLPGVPFRHHGLKGINSIAASRACLWRVFGAPYFIADGEPVWGGDRLCMLEHWLAHGSWDPALS